MADTSQERTGTQFAAWRTSESFTFWRLLTDYTNRCHIQMTNSYLCTIYADKC
jgi:hypothetical protein